MNAPGRTPELDRSSSKKIAREEPNTDGHCWKLEPHVCSLCFGRILSAEVLATGDKIYQCANCANRSVGTDPSVVCACGMKLRKPVTGRARGIPFYDLGIRCHANPEVSQSLPSLFVASHVGKTPRR